jgi:hypothetical protein
MSLSSPNPKPRHPNSVRVPFMVVMAAIVLLAVLVRLHPEKDVSTPCTPDQVSLRDGLVRVDDGTVFSGHIVEHHPDGTLKSRLSVQLGILEGLAERWHTNGTLEMSETFHEGKVHGLRTKWYPSGAKLSESTLVDGKMEGVFFAWHENGQPAEKIAMKNDKPSGEARAWYPSGFLEAAIGTNLSGRLEQRHWKDGECREWPTPSSSPR